LKTLNKKLRRRLKIMFRTLLVVALSAIVTLGVPTNALAGFDRKFIGEEKIYIAGEEDTLTHIARYFDLGFVELRAANPSVDPWIPGKGKELLLPSRHILPDAPRSGIVINLPEMRMYAFSNGDDAPMSFPLGIGREGLETPIGTTTVVSKKADPIWRPTPRMLREDPTLKPVVMPGPDNPMGTHVLYLGWPSYGLHGTNKPYGIGRRSSSGCIRLYPEDIITLFNAIPAGTKVTVVNQPIKLAWIDDVLYMEAHPDMQQALQMEETGEVYSAKMSEQDMAFIINAAGEHEDKLHWATIRNAVRDRTGTPIIIARKPGAVAKDSKPDVIRAEDVDLNDFAKASLAATEPSAGENLAQRDPAPTKSKDLNKDTKKPKDQDEALPAKASKTQSP
jgi:L,D-transpeptidase ErfK/SrfK